jgi:hypothetical protein
LKIYRLLKYMLKGIQYINFLLMPELVDDPYKKVDEKFFLMFF